MKKLDKKVLSLWLVRNSFLIIPAVVSYILLLVFIPDELRLPLGLSFGFLVFVILFLCIVWPILYYKMYEYNYDDTKIYINYGVIFRHKILMPVRQIQDLHLYKGPLMQMFKLSGITISTAGSNFSLTGISKDEADAMIFDLESKLERRLDSNE